MYTNGGRCGLDCLVGIKFGVVIRVRVGHREQSESAAVRGFWPARPFDGDRDVPGFEEVLVPAACAQLLRRVGRSRAERLVQRGEQLVSYDCGCLARRFS
ncbi:hypothetical protein ACQ4WX_48560 [Streptomyces lasalocidi]